MGEKKKRGWKRGILGVGIGVLSLLGIAFLIWYLPFANIKRAEKVYFHEGEDFVCSEENPFRDEILSRLKGYCLKPAKVYSYEELHMPVLYIEAKNGAKYEVYDLSYIPLSLDVESGNNRGPMHDFCIQMTKGDRVLVYRREYEEAEDELWDHIGRAKGAAYEELGTVTGEVIRRGEKYEGNAYVYFAVQTEEHGMLRVDAKYTEEISAGDTVEITFPKQTLRFDVYDTPKAMVRKVE